MKHKYKTFRFVNGKQVCEWEEEEIKPILYLNDYYNFLDTESFENAYGHGKGSKKYIYEVLEKHLKALEIIKEKRVDIAILLESESLYDYNDYMSSCDMYNEYGNSRQLTQDEFDLLKEVLL